MGRPSKKRSPATDNDAVSVKKVKSSSSKIKKSRKSSPESTTPVPEYDEIENEIEDEIEDEVEDETEGEISDELGNEEPCTLLAAGVRNTRKADPDSDAAFIGEPIPAAEAIRRWPHHYKKANKGKNVASPETENKSSNEYEEEAKRHYTQAKVDGVVYNLGDDAYVQGEEGKPDYIARIVEFFESTEGLPYFTAQWFYRSCDTVIKEDALQVIEKHVTTQENKRVFLSEIMNDNPLDCLVSKLKIALVKPNLDLIEKEKELPECDLYYDMKYNLPFLTYETIKQDDSGSDSDSTISRESNSNIVDSTDCINAKVNTTSSGKTKMYLLDLYSGCGAMSTGLCMGAAISGVDLVTRWAVDINSDACKSLKLNHPETEVRNEKAEEFLSLLKEWEKLCREFSLFGSEKHIEKGLKAEIDEGLVEEEDDDGDDDESDLPSDVFEVEKLLAMCYRDPNKTEKGGLHFKVRWKGYGEADDTWEPIDGLSDSKDKIKEFVTEGYQSNILPLPGKADFICGGPPCQGISGFNRFRNKDKPLDDPKNHQLKVFMDIVEYLKPTYVLMENVVDILRFAGGFLASYATGRLVSMNYQTRMGMMAAGAYGVPQYRMRMLLWGAHPFKVLPQFPLPTHEAVVKGGIPNGFEEIAVAYNEIQPSQLEKALRLGDAISDLPPSTNDEKRDERDYGTAPTTEFQEYIRLKRDDVVGYQDSAKEGSDKEVLYDHRPLALNIDDYHRVCEIPKRKGANFRSLPGVLVGPNNKVEWDKNVERVKLPSGKFLVPDYAMTYVRGTSPKPFGRLWWDEVVPTVVTRAEPHNQVIIHPLQDRVLTVRENARLQGFPDCYQLLGTIKERYTQVGNAVAVPVGVGLGYCLGLAFQGNYDGKPVIKLPFKYPNCLKRVVPETEIVDASD
ncbi:DNA (cytosine-5)-methyltransferase 1 [Euphorbia peplus]|nr:DNA (cytosine-5)-methyltransferase 1 [Euphorbia peplus]